VTDDHDPSEVPSPDRATEAGSWQLPELALHELPDSGNVAQLRKPSLMTMMRRGEIPNPLVAAAVDVLDQRATQDYQATAELLAFLVSSAFVEPVCVYDRDPGDGEISVDWLSDRDQQYILQWINSGEVPDVVPFPAE
jgi:hypothetical protein